MLKRLIGILSGVMATMLAGCSANFAPGPLTLEQTPIGEIQGSVHGGNFPVTGSQIYLFAAGQGGYGTSATSLMKSGANGVSCSNAAVTGACYVTTDAKGNFSVGGDYTCTEGQQVYMVAVGGNPGISGSHNNSAIVQMAALGQCPAAGNLAAQVPYLVINEVTTVAFAYAVGGFATNAFNVSSGPSGETALANAFANANNIVDVAYGQAPAAVNGNSNSINPQTKINALANVLVTCVNQSSATASACTNLFKYATDSSGTAATDETTAIFNIVHGQAKNVTNIWNLTSSIQVFQPTLTSAPTDWTMPVVYSGVASKYSTNSSNEAVSGVSNIAFDGNGHAWIGDRQKGVIEMTPTGAVAVHNPGFGMVKGIAVSADSTKIWVTDYTGGSGNGQLHIMTTDGTITASVTANMNGPSAVAVDANGNGFVVNDVDGSVVGVSSTGQVIDYTGAVGVTSPEWISLDNDGDIFLPSAKSNQVVGLVTLDYAGKSGKLKGFSNKTTLPAAYSYGVAVDSNNNVWFAANQSAAGSSGNATLDEILSTVITSKKGNGNINHILNAILGATGSNGGGLGNPHNVTVDGGNNIWTANASFPTVSEWSQTQGAWQGVQSAANGGGFGNGSTGNTLSATPDPSGNLWTANDDGSVTQLLGLATPTASPIYPGVQGTMP